MADRFPRSLARDPLRWIDLRSGIRTPDAAQHASRQLRTARALVARLFGPEPSPGVILGDEVGMGKTYEALATIAALFRHQPSARVLVLTHSHAMAVTWLERWSWFCSNAVTRKARAHLHGGTLLEDLHDVARDRLAFASYDGLKKMSTHDLRAALERCFEGRYLRADIRRDLIWTLLETRVSCTESAVADRIPRGALDRFWTQHFDPERRTWRHPWGAWNALRKLVYRASRTRRELDLLVVDEAHKVASRQRNMFFSEALGGRTRRALYVTATPFSLSVGQLFARIEDMHVVTNAPRDGLSSLEKDLESFRDIVLARGPLPTVLKQRLEGRLRRYLVRSLWDAQLLDDVPRRAPVQLRATDASSDEQRALATLALETALVRLSARGARTHSTAHRETLCSSYAAIREAARGGQRRATAFAASLTSLADLLPANRELPKFECVLEYLVDLARHREKAVVFCGRIATVHALRRALHDRLHAEIADERARWQRVRARLRRAEAKGAPLVAASSLPRLRLASHRRGKIPTGREASAVARLDRELATSGPSNAASELWDQAWGLRRRVDWVGVLAGTQEQDEKHRSAEAVRFAFNLPGPPYILLCTEIAREGIDLHLWCRRIVQYDLDWNPALMEQQIGRVDRIGSLSRRTSRPVEVVWAWMPGSYEEFMANKVRERMEMMKVLLGAGEWLAASPEQQDAVAALAQYQLDFAP